MAAPTFKPTTFTDFIGGLEGGQNSGVSPLLLSKNQIAFALNASLRGGYIKCRPPFFKKILDFANNPTFQALVESGVFQGAGYYRPDYGVESLLAQIGGRLIKFTENGGVWVVSDVSVPGDLNDPSSGQVWMWQSEKWMLVTDGTTKLPIFFDGTNSRRSYGESVKLGTAVTFNPVKPPLTADGAPDSTVGVAVTLLAPYTGQFNVPVIFNGEFYQPVESATGYNILLTNAAATPGTLIPSGSDIVVLPSPITTNIHIINSDPIDSFQTFVNDFDNGVGTPYVPTTPLPDNGSGSSIITGKWSLPAGTVINITLDVPFPVTPSSVTIKMRKEWDQLQYGQSIPLHQHADLNTAWDVIAVANGGLVLTIKLRARTDGVVPPPPGVAGVNFYGQREGYYWDSIQPAIRAIFNTLKTTIQNGQDIGSFSTAQPSFVLGKTVQDFNIPNTGSTITIQANTPFSGVANQPVTINGNPLQITPPAVNPPSANLILLNLTDTKTANYTNPTDIFSVPEIPAGRMGCYGMGRNWLSLVDGISYLGGDIVGGGSGTPANNFRDAVLKITENTFLEGGGTFRLPGSGDIINSMRFTANLDASLGQGALQIGTQFSFFSNNAPVDRTEWAKLTNPIQSESLIDRGSLGQNSTILINSDLFFRNPDGWGSLVLARRDFNTWGNKTISNEMQRPLNSDNQTLLSYGSAMNFKNRFLATCAPINSAQGIIHEAMTSLNFDLISSLRQTIPPAWEGIWTGLNILQVVTGRVNGTIRAFAFTLNLDTNKIELYELLPETTGEYLDNGVKPVTWAFESPVMFKEDIKPLNQLVQLLDGEVYLSQIKGSVHVKVMYRPDFMECWTVWNEFDVCADVTEANTQPGYRTRIGLGEPDAAPCEPGNNRQLRVGYFFQFRVEITGSCTWNGLRASVNTTYEPRFAPVKCVIDACQVIQCSLPDDLRLYSLQGLPPTEPAAPPEFFAFHNKAITLAGCEQGVCVFTNSPPAWITVSLGNLTVVAGTFGGQTQAEADGKATSALETFIRDNLESGNLTCNAVACTFTPSTLTGVLLNTVYSQQLRLSGLIQGTWSIAAGFLPLGLSLSPTGLLSGTPTEAGTFSIIVHVSGDGIDCNWPYNFLVYENMLTNFVEYFTLNETGSSNRASTGGAVSQPMFTNGGGSALAVAGILGSAFLCQTNATETYLRGLNNLLNPKETFNGTSYSFSIWINRLQATTGRLDVWSTRFTQTEGCALYFDTGNTLKWEVKNNIGGTGTGTTVNVTTANAWFLYTVTFNTSTQVLTQYVNGAQVSSQSGFLLPTGTDNSRRMTVSQFNTPATSAFACQAIGIWNTVLTPNQILHLYNSGVGIAYPF